MTLEEILALEEDEPCPGCPVCEPRLPAEPGKGATGRGDLHPSGHCRYV
jgi:hypothetical protein